MITYEELKKAYKKIVAWGGGPGFSELYKGDKKDIAYIVDSNEKLWGSVVSATDIMICSPQKVLEENSQDTVIIITSEWKSEIYQSARKIGIKCDIYSANEIIFEKEVGKIVKIPIPVLQDSQKMLTGKIALITGGSSGIGYGIAEQFLKSGCKVIIAGTNKEKLEKCQEDLNQYVSVKSIVLNVLEIDKFRDKITEAAMLFEENRIDILVNSAGRNVASGFMDIGPEEYDSVMDVNVKGVFFMSQAMGEYMIAHNIQGHILNISSAASLRPAWTPYQISKWAIKGFTLGLADMLLPHGIVVNAIAPGPVATPMLGKEVTDTIELASPSGRYALPCEIAALAVFMVSDFGNLIVGDTFYITGGGGVISLHR